ncbi:hypothetical protein BC938DRAFT_477391 [Jimgerdemannia flammicorona]|uniref:Uncharacterized protein n=1 Tax=Jimgerdemannia flammicorona TaxID=994334 RepID=A0A433QPD6_9FUNG|nr:hypothetical protein BC938DRAFT_477391 [Jimgerdemannia flammicorona]
MGKTNYYEIVTHPHPSLYHYDCKTRSREPFHAKPISTTESRLIMMEYETKALEDKTYVLYDAVCWVDSFCLILPLIPASHFPSPTQVTLNSTSGHADAHKISLELAKSIRLDAFNKGIRSTSAQQAGLVITAVDILNDLIHQRPVQYYIVAAKNFYYSATLSWP